MGVTELSDPINIQIGMTIEPGNLTDQIHFKMIYQQSSTRLREDSLVIFDKGTNSVANTRMIRADNLQYITGKKLNTSDDKIIAQFETDNPQLIDQEAGIRGMKIEKPKSSNYHYFSKNCKKTNWNPEPEKSFGR